MSGDEPSTAGDSLVEIHQHLEAADTYYALWLADGAPVHVVLALSHLYMVRATTTEAIGQARAEGRMARQAAAEIAQLVDGSD